MFESFEAFFCRDINGKPVKQAAKHWELCGTVGNSELDAFMMRFNSQSFRGGLYRLVEYSGVDAWRARIALAYPSFQNRIIPFGYDWLGRVFCVDLGRVVNGKYHILFFNIISNEVLEIPSDIVEFHDIVLIDMVEPALELKRFESYLSSNNVREIGFNECVEIVVPLYFGGVFELSNMRAGDLSLYWELSSQILLQSRSIEVGEKIACVSLDSSH